MTKLTNMNPTSKPVSAMHKLSKNCDNSRKIAGRNANALIFLFKSNLSDWEYDQKGGIVKRR